MHKNNWPTRTINTVRQNEFNLFCINQIFHIRINFINALYVMCLNRLSILVKKKATIIFPDYISPIYTGISERERERSLGTSTDYL